MPIELSHPVAAARGRRLHSRALTRAGLWAFVGGNALLIVWLWVHGGSEALRAQSANIDVVSGATDTSEAFINSLQSAIVKAKRA